MHRAGGDEMTLQVLTDIYPPHTKPVRDGWYLTSLMDSDTASKNWLLRFWDGRDWCSPRGDPYERQDWWAWKGLAFDPDAAIETTHTKVGIPSQRRYEIDGVFLPGAALE